MLSTIILKTAFFKLQFVCVNSFISRVALLYKAFGIIPEFVSIKNIYA